MYGMSRQISALLLSGIMACSNLAIPAFAADIDSTSSNSADMNNIVERSTDGATGPNDIVTNVIAQQIIGKLINK